MRLFRFTLLLIALGGAGMLRAAEAPSVTAVLTESETVVGRPVSLQIQVTGASNPKPPGDIRVDGLEIHSAGVSRQYQMQNFSVSYSFTYNYTVMPLKVGSFKIPPLEVEAGGSHLRTPELTLNVSNSSSAQTSRGGTRGGRSSVGGGEKIDPSQIGFVEMVLPKQTAYVGEMIPVQVRVGLNARAPIESFGSGVQIAGQGFTTQKMTDPRQTVESINGRTYQIFIFNTAISPVRSGKIELGPAQITPIVRVATRRNPNNSLPRDLLDDPFFNNFFSDPAFAPSMPKEVPLRSESATLDVKPLPANAPNGFAGAVGNFSLKTDANPKKAEIGDPITVVSTINGRGNFDRVNAPVLDDDRGWHSYPPSEKFKQDDDVGISGVKTFETVLSAKEAKQHLPPFSFAFFDPIKETYIVLKSDQVPLLITGNGAIAATSPTTTAAPATPGAQSPAATPVTPKEQDILYQLSERPTRAQTFTPLYAQRGFWLAQALPLLGLLGLVGFQWQRARSGNREAQRIARLQHEAAELQRKLRHDGESPQQYVANASRAVQLRTALARKVDPNSVDAEAAAAAFGLNEEKRARLERLFAESDELRYSGGRNGGGAISPEKRRQILELVEELHA